MIERTKQYVVNRKSQVVQSILGDLSKFAEFHPLMLGAAKMKKDEKGNYQYLVREKPYNWLPLKIKYTAIVFEKDNSIVYDIYQLPLVKPQISYRLKDKKTNVTEVHLTIKIEGMPIANQILMRKMLKAQDKVMAAINK